MFNGYLTFVFSILMIGLVTAVIGDVAGHLGCFIFLKDSVNAIAFVALGTSVPGKVHFIKTKILQAQVFLKLSFYFCSQNLYFCLLYQEPKHLHIQNKNITIISLARLFNLITLKYLVSVIPKETSSDYLYFWNNTYYNHYKRESFLPLQEQL